MAPINMYGDKLDDQNNDGFDEIVRSMSIGWQRKKAYNVLRVVAETTLVIHDIIDKLEQTDDEEDDMVMKALDAVASVCEVFVSTFEEYSVDEQDSGFDPFDEDED